LKGFQASPAEQAIHVGRRKQLYGIVATSIVTAIVAGRTTLATSTAGIAAATAGISVISQWYRYHSSILSGSAAILA